MGVQGCAGACVGISMGCLSERAGGFLDFRRAGGFEFWAYGSVLGFRACVGGCLGFGRVWVGAWVLGTCGRAGRCLGFGRVGGFLGFGRMWACAWVQASEQEQASEKLFNISMTAVS